MDSVTGAVRQLYKIRFDLEVDDDWPPVSAERMWARHVKDVLFELTSIPFYAQGIALGDTFEVSLSSDGVPVFARRISSGGHRSFQIIINDLTARDSIVTQLQGLGCRYEQGNMPSFIAFDAAPEVSFSEVVELLTAWAAEDLLGYEVSCNAH